MGRTRYPVHDTVSITIRMTPVKEYPRTSHAKRVIHNERDTMLVRNLCERREVRDDVLRVSDTLYIQRLRLLVDRLLKVRGVGGRDELDVDVELLQEHCS